MEVLSLINKLIALLFAVCYAHQAFFALTALFRRPKALPAGRLHRYAVLVSARNEEAVIGNLIQSIWRQDYPSDYIDIYVVADNCTDATAQVAREAGAIVWERFDSAQVGKGYALQYLFERIWQNLPGRHYDGYLIFDADNLLDEHYITEMNKTFSAGYRVVTSYRAAKNYGGNWLSAGYGLWFLREARYLNQARMVLGTSCAVSGCGFLIHHDIAERNHGWKHFLLTEDIEFTVDSVLNHERIGYCDRAVFYDEQPTEFGQSWRQRLRWTKGGIQVFCRYGGELLRGAMDSRRTAGERFACYDMLTATSPAMILTLLGTLCNGLGLVLSLLTRSQSIGLVCLTGLKGLIGGYGLLLIVGGLTLFSEWRRIHCSAGKKLLYLFAFPLFMYTYLPISIVALFKKVEWKPIYHTCSKTLEQVRQ